MEDCEDPQAAVIGLEHNLLSITQTWKEVRLHTVYKRQNPRTSSSQTQRGVTLTERQRDMVRLSHLCDADPDPNSLERGARGQRGRADKCTIHTG